MDPLEVAKNVTYLIGYVLQIVGLQKMEANIPFLESSMATFLQEALGWFSLVSALYITGPINFSVRSCDLWHSTSNQNYDFHCLNYKA